MQWGQGVTCGVVDISVIGADYLVGLAVSGQAGASKLSRDDDKRLHREARAERQSSLTTDISEIN